MRDEFVVHFTGRRGAENYSLPEHLRDAEPARRVWRILRQQAFLALRPFGRQDTFPSVCFCEGDEEARARLIRDGRYRRYGIAFYRDVVERWGARPVTYADADLLHVLRQALDHYELCAGGSRDKSRRLNLVRALLQRDWPGSRQPSMWPDIAGENQWSHEHEMRLVLPVSTYRAAYWTFDADDVAHLLLPEKGVTAGKVAKQADKHCLEWILDLPVRLLQRDGEVVEELEVQDFL